MFVIVSAIVGTVVSQCLVVEEKVAAGEKRAKAHSKRKRMEISARVLASPEFDEEYQALEPDIPEFIEVESMAFEGGKAFLTHTELLWWMSVGSDAIDEGDLREITPQVKHITAQQPTRASTIAALNEESLQG